MYAICQRFWGVEAWNLEVAVGYVLDGFAGVNWLTLIGESLRSRAPEAVEEAKRAAVAYDETPHGVVLQAAERPSSATGIARSRCRGTSPWPRLCSRSR